MLQLQRRTVRTVLLQRLSKMLLLLLPDSRIWVYDQQPLSVVGSIQFGDVWKLVLHRTINEERLGQVMLLLLLLLLLLLSAADAGRAAVALGHILLKYKLIKIQHRS